jgi:hypothetical protein
MIYLASANQPTQSRSKHHIVRSEYYEDLPTLNSWLSVLVALSSPEDSSISTLSEPLV